MKNTTLFLNAFISKHYGAAFNASVISAGWQTQLNNIDEIISSLVDDLDAGNTVSSRPSVLCLPYKGTVVLTSSDEILRATTYAQPQLYVYYRTGFRVIMRLDEVFSAISSLREQSLVMHAALGSVSGSADLSLADKLESYDALVDQYCSNLSADGASFAGSIKQVIIQAQGDINQMLAYVAQLFAPNEKGQVDTQFYMSIESPMTEFVGISPLGLLMSRLDINIDWSDTLSWATKTATLGLRLTTDAFGLAASASFALFALVVKGYVNFVGKTISLFQTPAFSAMNEEFQDYTFGQTGLKFQRTVGADDFDSEGIVALLDAQPNSALCIPTLGATYYIQWANTTSRVIEFTMVRHVYNAYTARATYLQMTGNPSGGISDVNAILEYANLADVAHPYETTNLSDNWTALCIGWSQRLVLPGLLLLRGEDPCRYLGEENPTLKATAFCTYPSTWSLIRPGQYPNDGLFGDDAVDITHVLRTIQPGSGYAFGTDGEYTTSALNTYDLKVRFITDCLADACNSLATGDDAIPFAYVQKPLDPMIGVATEETSADQLREYAVNLAVAAGVVAAIAATIAGFKLYSFGKGKYLSALAAYSRLQITDGVTPQQLKRAARKVRWLELIYGGAVASATSSSIAALLSDGDEGLKADIGSVADETADIIRLISYIPE